MDDEIPEWASELFTEEELNKIMSAAQRIEEDMTTLYDVTLSIPREEAITLCKKYFEIRDGNFNLDAMEYIASMVSALVLTVMTALEADDIDPLEED